MTLAQAGSIVGILVGVLTIASVIFVYLRAAAVKATLDAQGEMIALQQTKITTLESDLAKAKTRVESLEHENESFRSILPERALELTGLAEQITRLTQAEDRHHKETVAVLREIREAIKR